MQLFCSVKTAKGTAIAKLYLGMILAAAVFLSGSTFGADWEMRVTEDAALEISCSQVPVVRASYRFWGQKWSYAGTKARIGESRGPGKTFSGSVSALGLEFDGTVHSLASN